MNSNMLELMEESQMEEEEDQQLQCDDTMDSTINGNEGIVRIRLSTSQLGYGKQS